MSFSDIRGQDRPARILKGYLNASCLAGGYLFSGPEGIGKKLAARTLAKAVNCLEDNTGDSCDRCASCMKIENNQHPDVHIIDYDEAEIKIDYIRQLQREISFKPYEADKKVFIINDAHKLNPDSSNALLKILEEPPGESLIILITDRPALLFKTILSRCKTIKFSPMSRPSLEEILRKDYRLDKNLSHFLAYFAEGRLGRALSLKDTDILADKNRIIDRFVISDRHSLENLPAQNRNDIKAYLNILATWFRDIYLIKTGIKDSETINFDRRDDLLRMTGHFSFPELNEIMRCISDSVLYLDQNINTKLLLHNLKLELWKR